MDAVTIDQIKQALPTGTGAWWPVRACSICGFQIGYEFAADGDVHYRSACGCSDFNGYQPRSLEDVADTFNRQTPEIRARLWGEFVKAVTPPERDMSDPLRDFLMRHGVSDADAFLEDAEQNLEWGPSFRESVEIARLRAQLDKAVVVLRNLADAADEVGVRFFDTDTMEPEVERMQLATLAARRALAEIEEEGP